MKKFDRLPPKKRREEIQAAALEIFIQKGFAATTMENIVEKVSLSKGGVYRIYSSTTAILSDLMLTGMHLRNAYYVERVRKETEEGRTLTLPFLVDMIGDSLMLYPEFSKIYVEFLWEKQRNPQLEECYRKICETTIEETVSLIREYGADKILLTDDRILVQLTELMNATILSLHVLNLHEHFKDHKARICEAVTKILTDQNPGRDHDLKEEYYAGF